MTIFLPNFWQFFYHFRLNFDDLKPIFSYFTTFLTFSRNFWNNFQHFLLLFGKFLSLFNNFLWFLNNVRHFLSISANFLHNFQWFLAIFFSYIGAIFKHFFTIISNFRSIFDILHLIFDDFFHTKFGRFSMTFFPILDLFSLNFQNFFEIIRQISQFYTSFCNFLPDFQWFFLQ